MSTPQMTFDPASGFWFDNANGTPAPLGPYIQTAPGVFAAAGTPASAVASDRNVTNYFMASPVISTGTEALQSLTGFKGGAAVGATTTPAVVSAGKTYRVQAITVTYIGVAALGEIQVGLRANPSGVVAIGSPLVNSWIVGAVAAAAGVSQTFQLDIPDGMEFAAGTGLGLTVLGLSVTGTAAAAGYAKVSMTGFEY